MILMLQLPAEAVLPALALFRVVYYLVPLAVALVVLTIDEFYQRRHHVGQWGNAFGTLTTSVTPKLLAVFTMLGGAVLMFSGATPTSAGRLAWVNAIVPLPVIEVSHFVGSLVGFGLLVVAWGLARRLDAAYVLGAGGLAVGIATSLLKGADYEEALVLAALLVALVVSRDEFDRKAALLRHSVLYRVDSLGSRRRGRVDRPGAVRFQARRVLERPVVALRGRSGGAALPSSDRRRAHRARCSSACNG